MDTRDNSRQSQQGAPGASAQQGGGTAPGSAQQNQFSPSGQQQGGAGMSSSPGSTGADSDMQQGGSMAQQGTQQPSLWGRARNPFELMRRMDEEMDQLFRNFWGSSRALLRGRGDAPQAWAPQVEVFEEGGKLHVHADLPGMKKEDVKVTIEDDQLIIEGERRASREDDATARGGFFHSERSYGSFYRSIPLPEGTDTSTADASFADGVLKVHFAAPRQRQGSRRQIDIR